EAVGAATVVPLGRERYLKIQARICEAAYFRPTKLPFYWRHVGRGNRLGRRFEEFKPMRDLAGGLVDLGIGRCLDTWHLVAAGFDSATPEGVAGWQPHATRFSQNCESCTNCGAGPPVPPG